MDNEGSPSDSSSKDAAEAAAEHLGQQYWRANLRLVGICLSIWFVASYGCGILFADFLNQYSLFGFKLGFWFAQQGSIYIFLLLILFYNIRINALDRRFALLEDGSVSHEQEQNS